MRNKIRILDWKEQKDWSDIPEPSDTITIRPRIWIFSIKDAAVILILTKILL